MKEALFTTIPATCLGLGLSTAIGSSPWSRSFGSRELCPHCTMSGCFVPAMLRSGSEKWWWGEVEVVLSPMLGNCSTTARKCCQAPYTNVSKTKRRICFQFTSHRIQGKGRVYFCLWWRKILLKCRTTIKLADHLNVPGFALFIERLTNY